MRRPLRALLPALALVAATAVPVTAAHAAECSDTDIGGCYTKAQSGEIAQYAVDYASNAAGQLWPTVSRPTAYYYSATGTSYDWCGTSLTSSTFAYCPADGTIGIGQDQLWQLDAEAGDAAPVFGIAHEYAHHVQVQVGVRAPESPAESVVNENQADCMAGAVMGRLHSMGIVTDADFTDLETMVELIASEPDATGMRTHGVLSERLAAAVAGVNQGPSACNAYHPKTPVWTG